MFLTISLFGLMNIYATTYSEGSEIFDFGKRHFKQFIWMLSSLGLVTFLFFINLRAFSYAAYPVYIFILIVLLLVLAFGSVINGAKSWIVIGTVSIQPAEFAKFAVALTLAKYLSTYNVKLGKFKHLMKGFIIVFTPAALILLQNDMGSALVYSTFLFVLYIMGMSQTIMWLCVGGAVLFISTLMFNLEEIFIGLLAIGFAVQRYYQKFNKPIIYGIALIVGAAFLIDEVVNLPLYLIVAGAFAFASFFFFIYAYKSRINLVYYLVGLTFLSMVFVGGVNFSYNKLLSQHQRDRIEILLGLKSDPRGVGYNVEQSKIAIGSGAFLGKGYLKGTQTKFDFVPEQSTDFIFCTVGEEWGFVGSALLVALYVAFLLRLMFIADRQRSLFSRIYGYCVTVILFFHFIINIGMTIGLLPVIGIPLPFFSYGGSSFLAFTILLFVFVRLDSSRLEVLQ